MPTYSLIPNKKAIGFVRYYGADTIRRCSYNANVVKKLSPLKPPIWYLPEWMKACGLGERGGQTRMREKTGWSRAKMSELYNGTADISSSILQEAADALNVQPWELLMPPEAAFAMRRLRDSAKQIVAIDSPKAVETPEKEALRTGTK